MLCHFKQTEKNCGLVLTLDTIFKYRYTTKDSSLMLLKADMDLVKEMGFNSVRLVGIDPLINDKVTGELSIKPSIGNQKDTILELSKEENYTNYLNAIAQLLDVVNKAGLKAVFLCPVFPEIKTTSAAKKAA